MSAPLNLIPDAPINSPTFDRLDRMAFVRSFAEAIRAAKGETSVVLALAGPWGSGKSSLLNLIAGELEDTDPDQAPLLVRFNPWWFTETRQLVAAFLQQLGAAVSRPEVAQSLGEASSALDDLADALAAPGEMQKKDVASRDIQKLREKVVGIFRKSQRRILIFMDDIDRLSPEEMSQLLLIVRAIADFPHTTYVLSFDFDVVVQAMENKLGVDGRTYLEKVIQLQIDVPLPTRMTLERMVIGQLSEIDPQARMLDEDTRAAFRVIFESGIKHFLATPRACTRFLNVVRFIYPTVMGQIYLPDLLGLSCLMAFSSQAIQAIRSFQDAFVGHCDERGRGWVELSGFHEQWLSRLAAKDRPHVEAIVRQMFPKVAWALNGPIQGEAYLDSWNEQRRICSPSHFDTYFRLGLSAGEATEYRWQNLVELLDDATSFARALNQFGPIGDEKAESWLMDLLGQAADFVSEKASPDQASRMFAALMKRADQIDFVDDDESRLIEPIHRVVSLLVQCLQKIPSSKQRLEVVRESMEKDAGIYTATELIELLERRSDLFSAKSSPLDSAERAAILKDLVRTLDRRIQLASEDGTLEKHPRLLRILKKWYRYGRRNRVQLWLKQYCNDDEKLVEFLNAMRDDPAFLTDRDRLRKSDLPLEWICNFFGTSDFGDRLAKIIEQEPEWISLEAELMLTKVIDFLQKMKRHDSTESRSH